MRRLAAWLLTAAVGLGLAAALTAAVNQRAALTMPETKAANSSIKNPAGPDESAEEQDGADPAAAALETAQLQRLDPRAPLSGLASPAPPPPPDPESLPKRWRMVHQPVALAAGVIEAGGATMLLPGIDVVAVNETCAAPSGRSWPCGMAARTAFRAYLRGRALNCHLPDARIESGVLGECLLQGEDPAQWLVSHGWARAKADGPFGAQAQAAEQTRLGIYGPPPQ
jgi:endonuclease YncB( thermonuclease family)